MKNKHIAHILAALLVLGCAPVQLAPKILKPRLVVLTDIAPSDREPDDMESMIRLLVHADQFEIEGLIASTGWNNTGGEERLDLIFGALDAYEKDLPNLQKRSGQEAFLDQESTQELGYWPSPAYLRSVAVMGSTKMGQAAIGPNNDSKGSALIIQLADEEDDRPIWISTWGGANTFAQAVWRVQQERSPEEVKSFLKKFRVYAITDQDRPWSRGDTIPHNLSSHAGMRSLGKDLAFFWDESAWLHQNEIGKQHWDEYAAHIQNHGHLGAIYPKYKYGVEGDTPAFMHIMPNGISDPNVPTQVSWSGYFDYGMGKDSLAPSYTNHAGRPYDISTQYFTYFYPAIFNNFAARMDWAKEGKGNRNPVVDIDGDMDVQPLEITARPGETVSLDASKTYDPDGDALQFKWWLLPEAGTYGQTVPITDAAAAQVKVQVPMTASGTDFHIICEVTDNGVHPLTTYRRIIFKVDK